MPSYMGESSVMRSASGEGRESLKMAYQPLKNGMVLKRALSGILNTLKKQ